VRTPLLLLLSLLLTAPIAHAQWGRDINPGAGPQIVRLAEDELVKLLERRGSQLEVADRYGDRLIEGFKRFRGAELKPLFYALLEHPDWQVRHRALFALEYFRDSTLIGRAWRMLKHPNRRLREKAAITCIKLWEPELPAPGNLGALLDAERDFHVRRCLTALSLRIRGKLHVERVYTEILDKTKRGLILTPFVSGMNRKLKPVARTGGGSAKSLPAAHRWVYPLLGWGQEEVEGVSLQPFGNPRAGGVVHVGQDAGACLEGAGYYAAADGIVKLVHSGSDMGTLIVVEHHLGSKQLCNAVYMHGGDTVFVKAGERVEAGQLLGTMGMGFSLENGGHFAHLHFGLYPGPFSMTHNYGYKKAAAGLWDWRDPGRFLPAWVARTKPLVDDLAKLHKSLGRARAMATRGEYSRAFAVASRVMDANTPGSEKYVDASLLVSKLRDVPRAAVARAGKLVDGGYPNAAAGQLRELGPRCASIPGSGILKETLAKWHADPLFRKALKGEGRIAVAAGRTAKLDRRKSKELWEKLLREYGETCLADRIRAWLT